MTDRSRKTLLLHIGVAKTGTTAIQDALYQNRSDLLKAGYFFPQTPGKKNHSKLVTYSQDDGVLDYSRAHHLAVEQSDLAGFRERFARDFADELSNTKNWHTLLLSSEFIHSRLHTPSEIRRLFSLVDGFVDEIKIVIFVRRQDLLALSRFSTVLRTGHKAFDDPFANLSQHHYLEFPADRSVDDFSDYYDYEKILARFEDHVPDENICVIPYPEKSRGFDSVGAFAKAAGLPENLLKAKTKLHNTSASAEAQFVMANVNRVLKMQDADGKRNKAAQALHREIEKKVTGDSRKVSRADAKAFYEQFKAANERVAKKYPAVSHPLFSDDFSMHAESVSYQHFEDSLKPLVKRYLKKAEKVNSQTENSNHLNSFVRRINPFG